MAWRDRYRPASFRGVPFFVDSHDYEFGRRAVVHELPQRESPIAEDLGRSTGRFRVQAYVLGPDYMETRDLLIAACSERRVKIGTSSTAGTLVHPYLGTVEVFPLACRVREDSREGGIARFELTFTEIGEPLQPFVPAPGTAEVDQIAETVVTAAGLAAEDAITVSGLQALRDATVDAIQELTADLAKAQSFFTGIAQDVTQFAATVSALAAQAAALATAPADLVLAIKAAIDQVQAAAGNAFDALFVYETLAGFDSGHKSTGSSPASLAAAANAAAVDGLVRRAALAGAVTAAAAVEWESFDDALAAQGRVAALIDAELDVAEDAVFSSLQSLRAALTRAVPPPGESLPRLRELVLDAEEPALVTAWRLYGDAGRAEEIAARNHLPHPGLVPAGVVLQVLSQ